MMCVYLFIHDVSVITFWSNRNSKIYYFKDSFWYGIEFSKYYLGLSKYSGKTRIFNRQIDTMTFLPKIVLNIFDITYKYYFFFYYFFIDLNRRHILIFSIYADNIFISEQKTLNIQHKISQKLYLQQCFKNCSYCQKKKVIWLYRYRFHYKS